MKNPLKIIGSYIGLILGGLYGYFALQNFWFDIYDLMLLMFSELPQWLIGNIQTIAIHSIIGFFVGWIIHNFIIKLSKLDKKTRNVIIVLLILVIAVFILLNTFDVLQSVTAGGATQGPSAGGNLGGSS